MQYFNHNQLRRFLIAFGSFFTDLQVVRTDANGVEVQRMVVPLDYGPKEKWLYRITQDPDLVRGIGTLVPRLTYELSAINYDGTRKINALNQFRFATDSQRQMARLYAGVPYTLGIDLNILTKTQADAHQIVEQILPRFTPDLTFAIKTLPVVGLVETVPLTLSSVTHSDNYESNFETRRAIVWTLNFSMKVAFYGPVKSQGRVEEVIIDIINSPLNDLLDPPEYLATEARQLLEAEDDSGHVATEDTANTYITTGKVATIDVVANPRDQEPSANPTVKETLTEYE